MKSKEEIINNWLPRYTGKELNTFGQYILLTNFINYVEIFATLYDVKIEGKDKAMQSATHNNITIINFGMGSPMAATIMDLLGAIKPDAVLFLGKCGGLKKKNKLGDLILPIAAIRGEGTSDDYFVPEVPAMPAFALQKAISKSVVSLDRQYWTGTVYTTNRRVWEHDEEFKDYLRSTRAMGIDMETATIFTVGFYNQIPTGALLLVSDQPMISSGIKTEKSDEKVTSKYVMDHIKIGINALESLINSKNKVKHLLFS